MATRVTIDIFSGRPNPTFTLSDRQSREWLGRLRRTPAKGRAEKILPVPEATLGYRGMVIEQTGRTIGGLPRAFRVANGDVFAGRAAWRADSAFEDFVCGSTGPLGRLKLGRDFPLILVREIARLREIRLRWPWKRWPWPLKPRCLCAPLYEPAWWNVPARQPYNNCYNYGCNYRSDTFAQPGKAAGAMYSALSCASVKPAAVADALIDNPGANNKCPSEGHLVALVIAPGWDFHWYRKGRNGYWSHKPGGTAVTNLDNSGNLIPDPRTADRGPYTDFCTFMTVMHGHIKIK